MLYRYHINLVSNYSPMDHSSVICDVHFMQFFTKYLLEDRIDLFVKFLNLRMRKNGCDGLMQLL